MKTRRLYYGWVMVALAALTLTTHGLMIYTFGIFFKPLTTAFNWERGPLSAALSLCVIVSGLLAIITGRLCDKHGPRLLLSLAGLLSGIGFLLMSRINTLWQVYLIYAFLMGGGARCCFIPVMSTIPRWFTERRGVMTGIILTGTGIGALFAPPVANQLISSYHWRVSYIMMGSVVTVVIVLAAQFLRRDPTRMGQSPYGESKRAAQRLNLDTRGFSIKQAVKTRQLWTVSAMFFCFGFCMFAVMVHIVPHATDLGIPAATAASILATLGALSIVGRIGMGGTADRIGSIRVFIISFAIMSAALFWLMPAKEAWVLYLFAAIFGFASAGAGALISPLVAEFFGLRSHGLILGVTQLGFAIGAAVGPLVAGYLFDVNSTYLSTFILCAILSIVGLVLSIVLRPTTDKQDRRRAI